MVYISFIIVNWNTKDILSKCLKSIYDNKPSYSMEIILVDNASTDGSADLVRATFPEVIIIQNDSNLGFAKANNIGIRKSKGRYVCLINSDVLILENCMNLMIEFIDKNPTVGILSPKLLQPDFSLNSNCRKFPTLWNNLTAALGLHILFSKSSFFSTVEMSYFNHDEIRDIEVIAGSFWLVRRKAIDQVGLLDEDFFIYAEDMDWCRRFWSAGWRVVFFPQANAIHYHGSSSSKMPIKLQIQQYRAGLHYWKKYHGRLEIFFIRVIWLFTVTRRLIAATVLYLIRRYKRVLLDKKCSKGTNDDIKRHFKSALWLLNIPIKEE